MHFLLLLCFLCSLWRDLNINCCDKGTCNFYDSSSESCKLMVGARVFMLCYGLFNRASNFLTHSGFPFLSPPRRWMKPLALCMTVDWTRTPCIWTARVGTGSTEATRWPWATCLGTTGNTHTHPRWISRPLAAIKSVLPWNISDSFLFFLEVFRPSEVHCVSGWGPSLHQQHRSEELAERRHREESFTHRRWSAAVGLVQVFCKETMTVTLKFELLVYNGRNTSSCNSC